MKYKKFNGIDTVESSGTYYEAMAMPAKANAEKLGGFDDWILPTLDQLILLRMTRVIYRDDFHWSSTMSKGSVDVGVGVDFINGHTQSRIIRNTCAVRLMRRSQFPEIFSLAANGAIDASEI